MPNISAESGRLLAFLGVREGRFWDIGGWLARRFWDAGRRVPVFLGARQVAGSNGVGGRGSEAGRSAPGRRLWLGLGSGPIARWKESLAAAPLRNGYGALFTAGCEKSCEVR